MAVLRDLGTILAALWAAGGKIDQRQGIVSQMLPNQILCLLCIWSGNHGTVYFSES
jgi:hypothetical protein